MIYTTKLNFYYIYAFINIIICIYIYKWVLFCKNDLLHDDGSNNYVLNLANLAFKIPKCPSVALFFYVLAYSASISLIFSAIPIFYDLYILDFSFYYFWVNM